VASTVIFGLGPAAPAHPRGGGPRHELLPGPARKVASAPNA
jgi:hypothetical protein